jgi:enamine deaminase RidA (YjgF/YER057c/UK114 family)
MKELFSEPYPARAAIQVAKLPLDSLIEVEGIIVKK